jgi:hypothetical protein
MSSTGVDMTISPYATTSSNKHKSWDRDVEQRTKKILCGAERDLCSSKQQVGRAGKDGTNIPEIDRPNHSRLEDFEKAPRNKLKGLRTPRKKDSQKLKIKSTQEEGHSEDFSVSDWQFVKVDQIPPVILNLINGDSDKVRDEKALFTYLNKLNHVKNSGEAFWIRRSHESDFFHRYRNKRGKFSYPEGLTHNHRASAILAIVLKIYDRNFFHKEIMNFLSGELGKQRQLKPERIVRIVKMIKISTVLSIMYTSLFREHEVSIEEHIFQFIKCITRFLEGLGAKTTLETNKKDLFIRDWRSLLQSGHFASNSETEMSLAWKTVEYWMRSRNELSRRITPPGKKYCHKALTEVIHKIIFFSNVKTRPQ